MGVSVFTENLLSDLQINRNNLSLAYLVGTLLSGLMITRAGKLYDKHGARVMSFIAGVMLGLMLVFLTRIDRLVDAMTNGVLAYAHPGYFHAACIWLLGHPLLWPGTAHHGLKKHGDEMV